jgi:hypothetical protein
MATSADVALRFVNAAQLVKFLSGLNASQIVEITKLETNKEFANVTKVTNPTTTLVS